MAKITATGYVHNMLDNHQTFEQFTLSCARAFGACVTLRDEPMDVPPPDEIVAHNYSSQIDAAKQGLDTFLNMSLNEVETWGAAEREREIKRLKQELAATLDELARCQDMRKRVAAWHPPSEEHTNFKLFMLDQIDKALFKQPEEFVKKSLARAEEKSPIQYWKDAVADSTWTVAWYKKEQKDENTRTAGANLWLEQLRESFKS